MEDKRKRTLNFTSDEKSTLKELIVKYKDIIENKKSNAVTNAEKTRAWKRLSQEFNAISIYCMRTPDSLKICWENMKRQIKKESANRKRELFKTGGGIPPPPPPSTGVDQIIEGILGPSLEGLDNIYDSDFILDVNSEDTVTNNRDSDIELHSVQEVDKLSSQLSCSHTIPMSGNLPNKKETDGQQSTSAVITMDIVQPQLVDKENDNIVKWESWTPTSLKRPVSEVLRPKENMFIKRRRPGCQNLSDQLLQEKINLVKTLIDNAKEEAKRKQLILDEQLVQEKIKTKKLLEK